MLRYRTVPVTAFAQNCSIVWCDQTMEAAVIDPGGDIDRLLAEVQRLGVTLKAIWLTHAHIDHTGLFPKLALAGFRGRAWATAATRDLLHWLLPDAGTIQENDVARLNRRNARRADPEVSAIYTKADAEACDGVDASEDQQVGDVARYDKGQNRPDNERDCDPEQTSGHGLIRPGGQRGPVTGLLVPAVAAVLLVLDHLQARQGSRQRHLRHAEITAAARSRPASA